MSLGKSLMILSISLKNIVKCPKQLCVSRMCHNNTPAEAVTSGIKYEASYSNQIFKLLNNDNSPSSIITCMESNKTKVNSDHVIFALKSMKKFYDENNVLPSVIQSSPHFVQICSILNRHIRILDVSDAVDAFKILNLWKVSSSTMIMQSLLQIIRSSINNLSLDQIYYLTFLLKSVKPTHLSEAIVTALPEVFKAQFRIQIDNDSVTELKNALRYIVENGCNKSIVKLIINSLNNINEPIDVDSAFSILYSIYRIDDLPENFKIILYKVESILENNARLLRQDEVIKIISKMFLKTIKRNYIFYNDALLDKLIDQVINENYGFEKGTTILNQLNKIGHIHIPFLKYLSNICNSEVISQSQNLSMSSLITGFALANYKPPNWESLQEDILKSSFKIPDDVTLCYFALNLASLDCFDSTLLMEIFTADLKTELLSSSYQATLQQLYQSVVTLYPQYSGPWPSDKLIQSFKKLDTSRKLEDYPLLPLLEKQLGGAKYVKTNVITNLGQKIDHLVILQNKYPVSFEFHNHDVSDKDLDCISYVEDLNIPSDCEKVAILVLTDEMYATNVQRLQTTVRLKIKLLEAMSYKVVPLCMSEWMRLADFEKFKYIEREIGMKNLNNDTY